MKKSYNAKSLRYIRPEHNMLHLLYRRAVSLIRSVMAIEVTVTKPRYGYAVVTIRTSELVRGTAVRLEVGESCGKFVIYSI